MFTYWALICAKCFAWIMSFNAQNKPNSGDFCREGNWSLKRWSHPPGERRTQIQTQALGLQSPRSKPQCHIWPEANCFSLCASFSYTLFFKEVFSSKFLSGSIIQLVHQAVGFYSLLVAIVVDCLEVFRQVAKFCLHGPANTLTLSDYPSCSLVGIQVVECVTRSLIY